MNVKHVRNESQMIAPAAVTKGVRHDLNVQEELSNGSLDESFI